MEDVIFEQEYLPSAHHRFYREVTVVSVPLRFDEGVGLYICESYATGRPVVEPRRGSFPEIVGDGGILYEDESAAGLAEALEKILSDKALYDKKREVAQRMAEQRYSDEVCAKALVELYEKVIK